LAEGPDFRIYANLRPCLSIVWPKSKILIKQKLDQLTLSAAKQLHLRRVFGSLALLAKWLMDGSGVGGVMWAWIRRSADPRISNYQTPWCAFYKLDFERHPTSGQAEKLFATISAPDPLKCFFPMFYFFSPINVSDKWPNICHDCTGKNINIEWEINGY